MAISHVGQGPIGLSRRWRHHTSQQLLSDQLRSRARPDGRLPGAVGKDNSFAAHLVADTATRRNVRPGLPMASGCPHCPRSHKTTPHRVAAPLGYPFALLSKVPCLP